MSDKPIKVVVTNQDANTNFLSGFISLFVFFIGMMFIGKWFDSYPTITAVVVVVWLGVAVFLNFSKNIGFKNSIISPIKAIAFLGAIWEIVKISM